MIEIRRCRESDILSVMTFIDQHWHKGHVLAKSRELMDWQYRAKDGFYNFVLAYDGQNLLGVLGYIPTQRYDSALYDNCFLWLALWKLRDDVKVAGLGLRMLTTLGRTEHFRAIGVNGLNTKIQPLYRALGYRLGELAQYYMINPMVSRALVAAPLHMTLWPQPKAGDAIFTELDPKKLHLISCGSTVLPRKTPTYFEQRYLQHPFYDYRVFHITSAGKEGLIAMRTASHENSSVLRIVDFMGDTEVLAQSGQAFAHLMKEQDAEYIDFMQWGIPAGVLERAGFDRLDVEGPVVVPNYFEPFLPKNARILSAVKLRETETFMVFRADGDQDRPNMFM